jgi:hypothetical protein
VNGDDRWSWGDLLTGVLFVAALFVVFWLLWSVSE